MACSISNNARELIRRAGLFLIVFAMSTLAVIADPGTTKPDSLKPVILQNENSGQADGESGDINTDVQKLPEKGSVPEVIQGDPIEYHPVHEGETVSLELPSVHKVLPIGEDLPPIRLEAVYNQPLSLRDALRYGLRNNLVIRIADAQKDSEKWNWRAALGRFLPDVNMTYRQELLSGARLIGGVIETQFHRPNVVARAGFQHWGFRGGAVLFGALAQHHQYKAAVAALRAAVNDSLLDIANRYYSLQENQAVLQIRVKAVDTAREQLKLNQMLERGGTGTKFNVLQSETLLAQFEQELLRQEVSLRDSSIELAKSMNANQGINLMTADETVGKRRLISPDLDINKLISLCVRHRPELKQLYELKLAAQRNVQVAAAPLYPSFRFFGLVEGNGQTLGKHLAYTPPQLRLGAFMGAPAGRPLYAPSPTTRPLGTLGAVVESGRFGNRQLKRSYTLGFQVDWNYLNLGMPDLSNVEAARALARKAMLEYNRQLIQAMEEVRRSYLDVQAAENVIEVASARVVSSAEQLRLAEVRLKSGVGTNLDLITAQQFYQESEVQKAQALVTFNKAQVKLLRDIGLISIDKITSGRLLRN